MHNTKLTPEQQFMINQVEATTAIENMTITEESHQNLIDVATGRKTIPQYRLESMTLL